ncbi:AAA family ATPase [Salicibibacter kimchii]|uniref:DNA-binding protein n=1 Tax=Salicibibacter kimchii TaxID=2099786 RepID=A0A345BUG3_9BACI|nr:AAA family ATPase [Salicibibacter kimchii]AXF54594.1 DNA-binding protein [Salicibibacter kimchii]
MEIVNASQLDSKDETYLIYSPPGIGKTSTAKYLPGKTLILDMDRTTRVLEGNENIDIAYIDNQNTWKAWGKITKELYEMDLSQYENIFLDNVSEMERCMLGNLGREGKNDRVPEMRHYQQVQFFLIDSIRFLKSLGKRTIITAWETSDEWKTPEGQVFSRSYPQINGKILTNFMGLCDVVGKLVYNEETENRGFLLQPTNSVFAKNQLDDRKFCLQEELVMPNAVQAV